MNNKYRVAMTDSVNGQQFTFAVVYHAANANVAGHMAITEWDGLTIVETKRVV
ncbi:hypothetical protein D3C75_659760 [compost metagenome]